MSSNLLQVTIHRSCFPERQAAAIQDALRTRQVPGKLHYLSTAQTHAWLAVHERHSPARTEDDCQAAYAAAVGQATRSMRGATEVAVIGLGCGGGQKDARLLGALVEDGAFPVYLAHDVSVPMVITAVSTVRELAPNLECFPLVADVLDAADLPSVVGSLVGDAPRVVAFLGLIHNFDPVAILPRLAAMVRAQDVLLLSANLAPGPDYRAGCAAVLPQYDNPETRAWLWLFLKDLGFEPEDGRMEFAIEPCSKEAGLLRVAANWKQLRRGEVLMGGQRFVWEAGAVVRLFFSYRHTPDTIRRLLGKHGLSVAEEWITPAGQEGVFLCRRTED